MRVRFEWRNGTVDILDCATGEVLESGIVCLAFAQSLAESRGWEVES